MDECLTEPCETNANCSNTDGSFKCTCNSGYFGDGNNCSGKLIDTDIVIYVAVQIKSHGVFKNPAYPRVPGL